MGEVGEPLEPGGRQLRGAEVVVGEVQVPERREAEDRRMKRGAPQAAPAQVERRDGTAAVAMAAAAADAVPAAAVRAGPPRREGRRGGRVGGGERAFQPEQRCRLAGQTRWDRWRRDGGGAAVVGVCTGCCC